VSAKEICIIFTYSVFHLQIILIKLQDFILTCKFKLSSYKKFLESYKFISLTCKYVVF